jgi:hypothetical protein
MIFSKWCAVNDSKSSNNESDENGWRMGLVVLYFFLVFRLDYSDFKVNKMGDRLEWYFDKSIWTSQRSIKDFDATLFVIEEW